ncbi:Trafficking protein particle complex subunit 12 [Pseudolycoriella hygida]|uniref:Trafficking protein particle complex subunit 12 n=1 Tax=Pseudolycoriella hygida TaxID=35572 RepID=A0A9Q0NDX3_9DIPT|nr:Trafficking protein particle complex subunit 12 [Pseudolycoriella hygida]
MTTPKLSQYFSNDPPSLFDQLSVTADSNPNLAMSVNYGLNESTELNERESVVPEDVKDMWAPPHTEPGIPPLLTMPGVQSPNDLSDPIRDAVNYLLGETEAKQRKVLSAEDVTQDERGLRQLIECGCFRSAVNLTGRLLTIYGQGQGRCGQPAKHTTHSLQLWFTRFALLMKLGQYDLCQFEAEAFGSLNRSDVYFEFYPEMYPNRKGSMASFSFRLLLAELPSHLGQPKLAIDKLTEMSLISSEIKNYYGSEQANAFEFWQQRECRVNHSLVNCALMMKDFSLADHLMDKMTKLPNIPNDRKRALYSAWGRIYLQCGDVFGAEQKFLESRRSKESNSVADLRDLIDRGLIAVAQNDFQTAYSYFENALKLESANTMVLLNNMGVCKLYTGKLKDAIALFERAVISNPQKGLNESLLLNLSTLYELESSKDVIKKLTLLKQINRHKNDLNINLEYCLKLQTGNKVY